MIEPVIFQFSKFRHPVYSEITSNKIGRKVIYKYSNPKLSFKVFAGNFIKKNIEYTIYGDKGNYTFVFKDSFSAFKSTLKNFTEFIISGKSKLSRDLTLQVVRMIEMGNKYE